MQRKVTVHVDSDSTPVATKSTFAKQSPTRFYFYGFWMLALVISYMLVSHASQPAIVTFHGEPADSQPVSQTDKVNKAAIQPAIQLNEVNEAAIQSTNPANKQAISFCRLPKATRLHPIDQCQYLQSPPPPSDKSLGKVKLRFGEGLKSYITGRRNVAPGSGAGAEMGMMVAFLHLTQLQLGIRGTLGEIGVHHGYFWNAIALGAAEGESLFAADVFSHKSKNIDASGNGDLGVFLKGAKMFGINKEDITIFEGSSDELPFVFSDAQPFRMFSVDGGHTFALTYNDIGWVACNMAQGGVIIVDDVGHWAWPGVDAGLYNYISCGDVQLAPFVKVIGGRGDDGKLFLTTPEYHQIYYDAVAKSRHFTKHRVSEKHDGPKNGDRKYYFADWPINIVRATPPALMSDKEEQDVMIKTWATITDELVA